MSTEKDAIIIDSILHAESDLLAAAECYRVFPAAVDVLIKSRPERMNAYCAANGLPELTWLAEGVKYQERWTSPLLCSSGDFLQARNIGILAEGAQSEFRRISYGIYWLDKNNKAPWEQTLHNALGAALGPGQMQNDWIWHVQRPELANWTTPEMLAALYGESPTGPEMFCLEIYRVVKKFFTDHPEL